MAIGQRALFVWMFSLLTLIFLVVYLDGGLDGEPLIFFILLWLLDAFALGVVALRCVRFYYSSAAADEPNAFASEMPKLSVKQAGFSTAVILSKLAFEVVLCIQLRRRSLDVVWVMAPLWMCFSLVIFDLSTKIADVHRKIH